MRTHFAILILTGICCLTVVGPSFAQKSGLAYVDFFGQPVFLNLSSTNNDIAKLPLSKLAIEQFYLQHLKDSLSDVVTILQQYKQRHNPDDWLFYQLIRRTAQQLSPKEKNYHLYTLYKWFLLTRTGYDAILTISSSKVLFYIQCDENIYNIPNRRRDGKQYVCLNAHDYYNNINFITEKFEEINLPHPTTTQTFSYKVSRLPDIAASEYLEKDLQVVSHPVCLGKCVAFTR